MKSIESADAPDSAQPQRRKIPTGAILLIVALVALAAYVVYRWRTTGFEWNAFGATFRGVHAGWLALALTMALLTYVGRAFRWEVMVRPLRPNPSVWNILVSTAIGFTAIVVLGRAGELVRPYLIAVKERVSFSSQLAAWVLERILDIIMVLVIFGIALSQISNSHLTPGPHLKQLLEAGGWIIGVIGTGCLFMLLLLRHFSESMLLRLMRALRFLPESLHHKIGRIAGAFIEGLQSMRSTSFAVMLLLYSILEWAIIIASFICIFRAFPVTEHLSITEIVIFLGCASFGTAIQIPGVGGGLQVATVLILTEMFSFKFETATSFAIVLWAITFVAVAPFGLALAFREGLNWAKLKSIREDIAT